MKERQEEILHLLTENQQGLTASDVAERLNIDRSNASRYLSELYKAHHIVKTAGRPVVYSLPTEKSKSDEVHVDSSTQVTFETLVGENDSLKVSIQQAKAAILYPPRGLHTIIFGETGTGKSMFAECMYHFAIESEMLSADAPFVSFNCADYAQNPQLLFGHIFGIKKGAYTGAAQDSPGLIAKADGGILFLDEIHRLPPEGQEMLFTFIDKGIYRPLGESAQVHEASVQIIGATTESSESFLTTFNRRIPMAITLPNLASRSLDERYEIISLFIKQEANRLNQRIDIEKEAILAFMLYDAEGNIGQVKRDLKLVCAKSFLHYRTHHEKKLIIRKEELSLQVQKGLLKIKEIPERLDRFMDSKSQYLTFEPGFADVVWSQDPERNMQVYNDIEEKVTSLSETGVENIDLETLISKDVDAYFQTYVKELTKSSIPKDLLPDEIWRLTNQLYDVAEKRLDRIYNEKARFAFALHLQSTLDRVREGHMIVHPDLNNVRKNFKREFQVAIDLSTIIEEEEQVEIPFDEIGFISMFLSINLGESEPVKENKVDVLVLMHGRQTASSMLEMAQELLGTKVGKAFNMPLVMEVQTMYEEVLQYVKNYQGHLTNGLLLLTDMGSLNTFSDLIYEETGIRTKAITMTSTMIVIEAIRMASVGRSLEDIYQNIQLSFESIVRDQFKAEKSETLQRKKAVIVTCFTGEGVAAKLYQRIMPVINQDKVELIQMQFLERESFKKHIDALLEEYEIKAIAGTVDVDYQNIPFFSAYDVFDDEKLNVLKRIADDEVPTAKIVDSLSGSLSDVFSIDELIRSLQKTVQQIQTDLSIIVEPGVDTGIVIHLAFMLDGLIKKETHRQFEKLSIFSKIYRLEMDIIRANLMALERKYQVKISEDDIAFLTQMFLENKIKK
ncbi:sigma-54-dependent transcriptional regulator [Enterococcus faecium]|uniref:sigma 54-interacting transcriptional regulator n=1 Tax=Enterococcus faecium TaxID=1352 RepID=UPI00041E0A77|nr:sigma-54-dependent transcriptional regulator [Enterococcus faecium]EGP4758069.1 PRD domain-containing protein [Enterococcus faecium]EGP4981962.1 PRD domain-containing protein [Enterococcus faecium]EGP5710944.1 sigma-54-dependent transcriptional regulator [Enterococcus faecium]EGP5719378.1 sigma-54-dependent transcriptional regulator [Enterococcus faecium]EJB5628639.1 sigma 54-interacting transcriptional regulator [Enterococcus faecium]